MHFFQRLYLKSMKAEGRIKSTVNNGFLNLISNGLAAGQQVIISILISKLFGIELFGQFTIIVSIAYILSFLYNLGFPVTSLIYFQKKYYNILRVLLTQSYLGLCIILACSLFIPSGYVFFIAVLYTFSLTLKELLNTAFVAKQQYLKKISYNFLELIISIPVFLLIYFISVQKTFSASKEMLITVILILLIIIKLSSLLFFIRSSDLIRTLAPVTTIKTPRFINIYRLNFYNTLNTTFANIYSQGYYPVIGWLASAETVSLVKYIGLFQNIISLTISSYLQTKSFDLIKYIKDSQRLLPIRNTAFLIQFLGMVVISILVTQTDLLEFLFGLKGFEKRFAVGIVLAYSVTPLKQFYAMCLTIKGQYKARTMAIVYSVLFCLPILSLIKFSEYYLIAYILCLDLAALILFIKNQRHEHFNNAWLV